MARKNYTDEFRRRAVDLFESSPGATLKGIAADLGVSRGALKEWVDKLGSGATTRGMAEASAMIGRHESQAARIVRLEAENAALTVEARKLETERDMADSTGCRNTSIERCSAMVTADWSKKTSEVPVSARRQWRADRALRPPMRSPGRPEPSREVQRQFWRLIATGITSAEAALTVGVSVPVGTTLTKKQPNRHLPDKPHHRNESQADSKITVGSATAGIGSVTRTIAI